ncbi:MAG: hypothetical protein H7201_05250 [Candidatus Saccharibacteria bacterium]|nr:hypothetical protein [Microbacteriaceae bacterium]
MITFPTAGIYTFTTNADDGTALWINDVNLINEWQGGNAHVSSAGTITGRHFGCSRERARSWNSTLPRCRRETLAGP